MTVNRGVGNKHGIRLLRHISAPKGIETQRLCHLLTLKHRAVQRSNLSNLQTSSLLKHSSNIIAILAAYVKIVPSCLRSPVISIGIINAKFAKAIGAEESLLCSKVGHNNLRPVHHRRSHKGERHTIAKVQSITLFNNLNLCLQILIEIKDKFRSLQAADYGSIGILSHKSRDRAAVVRLHMLHNKIIGSLALQSSLQLGEPLAALSLIYSIHNCQLLTLYKVAVIAHSLRNIVLTLKEIYISVVNTYIYNITHNTLFKKYKNSGLCKALQNYYKNITLQ